MRRGTEIDCRGRQAAGVTAVLSGRESGSNRRTQSPTHTQREPPHVGARLLGSPATRPDVAPELRAWGSAAPLLTVEDVRARLRISRSCAYTLVASLPGVVRVGRAVRVPEEVLTGYIERGGGRQPCPGETRRAGGPHDPR